MNNKDALSPLSLVSQVLIIVGALNWGLFGLFHVDLVSLLFGEYSYLSRVVYTLVGIAGAYLGINILIKKMDGTTG